MLQRYLTFYIKLVTFKKNQDNDELLCYWMYNMIVFLNIFEKELKIKDEDKRKRALQISNPIASVTLPIDPSKLN